MRKSDLCLLGVVFLTIIIFVWSLVDIFLIMFSGVEL